jgi:hypothetical protein
MQSKSFIFSALEYTGGVPYDLLKPVLQHATPEQLFMLEHHNPYLIEDTGELWQFHCQREFRTKQRQDMETAREMYMASWIAVILQLGVGAQKYCSSVYFETLASSAVSGLLVLRCVDS